MLAHEFDRMLERLDATKRKLVEKSFISGMAEISSEILHNARNALSPVVSGLERIGEKIIAMDSPELRQAVQEVEQFGVDPRRKADLQRFLLLSVQDQQQYLLQARENLNDLSRQVYQVEEMLNGQRSFCGAAKPLESVTLKRLIEDTLELIPANLRSEVRIHVDACIEKLRPIHVQRVIFLQVLENLLMNAAESLRRAKPIYPKIKISAGVELVEDVEMLHLQIEDNGAGIDPKVMEKLFERGVSTKPQGMAGIGLHWCANTISAMKGRIWAESKGADQGACFHIVMPVLQDKESLMVNEKGTKS
jgi:signal transduction histidine kinase